MTGLRVATYSRVSTAEQVSSGTSLADQRARLAAAVVARGGVHVGHFEDAGISGALDHRPGLDALRADVAAGLVDVVMATKIDRVSRSAVGLLNLVDQLRGQGCHLVLIDEGLDTSTPAGDLTSGVLGVIGGWERRRIAERTKQGRLSAAATQGRFVGSTPPFGYRAVPRADGPGKQLVIDHDAAATIRALFRHLVLEGYPGEHVAARLNEHGHRPPGVGRWTAEHVQRWARRPEPLRAASGIWVFSGVAVPIPAILSPAEAALWEHWQSSRRRAQHARGPYLLSGYLFMPCGRVAMGRTAGTQRPTYSCRMHYLPASNPERHQGCLNVGRDITDDAVTQQIRTILTNPDLLSAIAARRLQDPPEVGDVAALVEQLAALDRQIHHDATALRGHGFTGPALAAALADLNTEHTHLTQALNSAQARHARTLRTSTTQRHHHLVAALRQSADTLDDTDLRGLLDVLDTRITITSYRQCHHCHGSGYLPLTPGSGRRFPQTCPHCLKGRNPNLTIEIDDITALALSNHPGQTPTPRAS